MDGTDRAGPQLPLGLSLAPGATFGAFFAGPNGLAVELLRTMAAGAGERQAWLAGHPGLGKSHLLQAAAHVAAARDAHAAYLPLDGEPGRCPEVLDGLDSLDLVCLDAVDAVAARPAWQRALFSLIEAARASGTRLLFAARRPPGESAADWPDLLSRLSQGPVLRLAPLAEADRRDALIARARTLGLDLPPAVADYLDRHFPRDLAGQFERLAVLDRASLASGRRLTVPFVKQVLDGDRSAGLESP